MARLLLPEIVDPERKPGTTDLALERAHASRERSAGVRRLRCLTSEAGRCLWLVCVAGDPAVQSLAVVGCGTQASAAGS